MKDSRNLLGGQRQSRPQAGNEYFCKRSLAEAIADEIAEKRQMPLLF